MRFRPSQLPLSAPWRSTASNVYCEHDGVKRHCVNIRCESVIWRSEEHTSELQSQSNLVCRLLLEEKNALSRAELVKFLCFRVGGIGDLTAPPPDSAQSCEPRSGPASAAISSRCFTSSCHADTPAF